MARADGVMPGFPNWMSVRFPAPGGHPSLLIYDSLVSLAAFDKPPRDLSATENTEAAAMLCRYLAEYLDDRT